MLETNVGAVLDKAFKKYKGQTAFKIGDREYSYGEVGNSVDRLAQSPPPVADRSTAQRT